MNHKIRWMIRRDMDAVLLIEAMCFPQPWDRNEFISWLRCRNCIGMVAERDKRVEAFMVYQLFEKRLEVVNFAVLPAVQRTGVGRAMFETLTRKLSSQRRSKLVFPIRETNLHAQLWARAVGFTCSGIDTDRYKDSDEPAYVFEYRYSPERDSYCVKGSSHVAH